MNDGGIVFFVVLPLLWILYNISCFLIIVLHELGHAIPSLIFTKQKVTIYIGSYNDENSRVFRIGKLFFKIKPRFFYTAAGGACHHQPITSIYKNIIVLLAGPFASAIISFIFLRLIFMVDGYGFAKLFVIVFFASSILSLAFNLYPRKLPTDNILYSDGHQLLSYLKGKDNLTNLTIGCKYVDESDYANAIKYLSKLDKSYISDEIYRLFVSCCFQIKDYKAVQIFDERCQQLSFYNNLESDDYSNLGYSYIELKLYKESLFFLNKSILLNQDNAIGLNNRGFVYNILGNYVSAKTDLNQAIKPNTNFAYAYNNRAYSDIKLGNFAEALVDINKAFELDNENSYAYLTNGIYLLETGEFTAALENFEKARLLDSSTLFVDDYIGRTKNLIFQHAIL